jgi:glutathione S-transferase
MPDELVFYYAPQTRASGVRVLLAELGIDYTPHRLDLKAGEHLAAEYRAINPMGKVPAIRHNGTVVTEQVAITIYLADAFPAAGLAPAIGDPLRGAYLRWIAFHGACLEPACIDRALKREPGGRAMSPYGDFDTMHAALLDQLRPGPWLLGERFTAADLLYGTALGWLTHFGIVPKGPEVGGFLERFQARPAFQAAMAADAAEAGA